MTIIIDSLTSTEACAQSNSVNPRNDTCQITATFHTVDPSNPAAQPVVLGTATPIVFQRNLQNADRFVLAPSNSPVVMGMIHANQFNPRDPRLLSALNYSGPLRSMMLDGSSSLYRSGTQQRPGGEAPLISDPNGTFRNYLNEFFQYLLVGEIHQPDVVQRRRNDDLIRQSIEMPDPQRDFVRGTVLFYVDVNRDRLAPEMAERSLRMRDILDVYKRVTDAVTTLPDLLKNQIGQLFFRIVQYLYYNDGSLAALRGDIQRLAVEIYRWQPATTASTPVARINLYQVLGNAFSQPLLSTTRTPRDNPEAQVDVARLAQRTFFQSGEGQSRLNLFMRAIHVENPDLNEHVLRYSILTSPRQAIIDSLVVDLSRPGEAAGVVANLTHETRIRGVGRLNSDWLRTGDRLREILTTLLFDPAGSNASQSSILQERGQDLPVLRVRLSHLRGNVQAMVARHPREQLEYRAAALALMHRLFGNGTPRHELRFRTSEYEINLPLEIVDESNTVNRGELVRFYEDLSVSLGATLGSNNLLTGVEIGLTTLGVGGSVARVVLGSNPSIGNFRPGEPDAALGATAALTCLGGVPLAMDAILGFRRNNRTSQNVIGGLVGGLVCGLAGGFIPMAFGGGESPPSMTPPMPMGRPINGRNPTSEWGP